MPQHSGIFTLSQQAQALTSGQWVTEPNFKDTTLLIQSDDSTNGAQNNLFLDSSDYAWAITRSNNTTQGSFNPYGTAWSNYFAGAGNYLGNTSTALIGSSTSTFTVEAWVFMSSAPTSDASNVGSMISLDGQLAGNINYLSFGPVSDQKLSLYWYDGGSRTCRGSTVLALGTWYHIAVVVTSNVITMYVNGVAETLSGTTTLTNRAGTSGNFVIGSNYYSALIGYISNLRVTNTAVYSSGFTPSKAPLTAISGTQLLTCQTNNFKDNSSNNYTFTVGSTPRVQRFSPSTPQYQYTPDVFGGSGYFDGTGDSLSVQSNSTWALTGDFTLETWVYLNSLLPGDDDGWGGPTFLSLANGGNAGSIAIYWQLHLLRPSQNATPNSFGFSYNVGSNAAITSTGVTPAVNQWYHMVVTRSSNNLRMFVNGVLVAYSSGVSGTMGSASYGPLLGAVSYTYTRTMNGYLSGTRVINGSVATEYQTSSTTTGTTIFNVPSAPYSAVANTSLLCNFTNAAIVDSAMTTTFETVGNAQVSTSKYKNGGGSLYFDGSGDYLLAPYSPSYHFGTGDFTVEFWCSLAASGTYNQIIGTLVSGTEAGTWRIGNRYNSTNLVYFARGTGAGFSEIIWNASINDGLWHHVALVRANGVFLLFVDGVSQNVYSGTVANSSTCSSSNALYVGYNGRDDSYINGYLDDVRITQGVARYTSNFIPPRLAFAKQ